MTKNISRIRIELPHAYRRRRGLIDVRHEEDALCWFWAHPELLPWPAAVRWLYTPVVGKRRWPGDLWGIDRRGELLIVECKQCCRGDDPFRDFVDFHYKGRVEFTSAHWLEKWRRHLRAELAFPTGTQERRLGKTDGVLPRSSHRGAIRRWPALARQIDAQIRSSCYTEEIQSALLLRERKGNPPPHYLALMVRSSGPAVLTTQAAASRWKLERIAGKRRVHVVSAYAEVLPSGRVRLSATLEEH